MDWKGFGLDAAGDGIRTAVGMLDTAAKLTLNTLYPREFEVYMVTLELVDYKDQSIDYFTFPINPESISKTQPYVKQIDRTAGAIVVNKTGYFVPQDINIKGVFGRQFRFVTRDKSITNFNWSGLLPWTTNETEDEGEKMEFNRYYKSGYGCFKIVQSICDKADKLDDGKARKLYFHNLAMGESYLVEVMSFTGSQSQNTNMIWNYDLRMKILSKVFATNKWLLLAQRLGTMAVTKAANAVADTGKELVSNAVQMI